MSWCLVAPSNRGIGFALTRHLLQTTKVSILATARKDVEGTKENILDGLKDVDHSRLNVVKMDFTDESTIIAAADQAKSLFPPKDRHLRLAFCIPGILHPEKSPLQLDADQMLATFRINTIGPLLCLKHFAPFLPSKKTQLAAEEDGLPPHAVWATMSARVGSTSDNALGGWYSYRASKAGVNSLTKTFDLYLKQKSGDKAVAVALHPGTVRTGLSKEFWGNVKESKLFTPEFASESLLKVVTGKPVEEIRGRCWDWDGKEIPP